MNPTYLFLFTTHSRQIRHTTSSAHTFEAGAELGEINVSKTTLLAHIAHTAHTAKVVCVVILGSFVLFILIDPLEQVSTCRERNSWLLYFSPPAIVSYLVKVGLQEVQLLLLLGQTRPVLLLELLLPQDHLDLTGAVVHLAVLNIDGIE